MTAVASPANDPSAGAASPIEIAAHEIRTPLGGILALADLLLAEDLSEAARGHASALKSAAEHLLGVASGLLGQSAPERRGAVDLDAFLGRVSPPIAARAAAKGLAFRAVRAPDAPDRIVADEGALRQIVDNLADNALRATDAGAIELVVSRVGGDGASATLKIALRDTGSGIGTDPEKLFAPFVQGEGPTGAAGLGLALVAELARRMGGRAEARNRPEGGAEVSATVRVEEPNVSRPRERPLSSRVLVAEDNPVNRRVVGTLLEHFGLSCDMVEDGAAAVEAVATGAYDLVLMDAVMPFLDGLDATRAIRRLDGPAKSIRVVGVTARAFDHEIRAFLAAGADAVVTKPLSVAELWRALGAEERRWAG